MTYRLSRGSPRRRDFRSIRKFIRLFERPVKAGRMRDGIDFWKEMEEHGTKAGLGWGGRLFGACPVQGEGEVDGASWYFRARGEGWSFEITPDTDELENRTTIEFAGVTAGGPYSASWMMPRHAWSLIKSSIAEFRRRSV